MSHFKNFAILFILLSSLYLLSESTIENVCIFFPKISLETAVRREESIPPLRQNPIGTSDLNLILTALKKFFQIHYQFFY